MSTLAEFDSSAPLRYKYLKQTCTACPSQWEAIADDGRDIYVRYRNGLLAIGEGGSLEDAIDSCFGDGAYFCERIGDDLDGFIEWSRVCEVANLEPIQGCES